MEIIALYIGYAIIAVNFVIAIGILLLVLCGTVMGLSRIIKYKQTTRFLTKHEQKETYKACKTAVHFLISKGVCRDNTLQEAIDMIENYKIRYKIKDK